MKNLAGSRLILKVSKTDGKRVNNYDTGCEKGAASSYEVMKRHRSLKESLWWHCRLTQ